MTENRTAKVNIEQIGIDEDVLFNLMTHDAKYDFYALRPDEVTELQNSIKAIIDDRERLRAKWNASTMAQILDDNKRLEQANAALMEALKVLVEIDRRDNMTDPDITATDRWRHEAWGNAYAVIDAANDKTEPG